MTNNNPSIQDIIKKLVTQYLDGHDVSNSENQIRIALTNWIQKQTVDIEIQKVEEIYSKYSYRKELKKFLIGQLSDVNFFPIANNSIEQEYVSEEDYDSRDGEYDSRKQKYMEAVPQEGGKKKQKDKYIPQIPKSQFILKNFFEKALYGQTNEEKPIPDAVSDALDVFFEDIQEPDFKNDTPFQYFCVILRIKFMDNVKVLKKYLTTVHKSSENNIISFESPDEDAENLLNYVLENWENCYKDYNSSILLEQTFTDYFDEVDKKRVKIRLERSDLCKIKILSMVKAILEEMQACLQRHYHCQNTNNCTNIQCWVHDLCRKKIPYTQEQVDKRKSARERKTVENAKKNYLENYKKNLKLKGVI